MKAKQFRQKLERQKGQQQQIERDLESLRIQRQKLRGSLKQHQRAREIIKQVGIETQRQLQYNISEITSLALESVFDNPYELVVEFVERRNKTECDLWFQRDNNYINPMDGGFGAVNIAAFALRVASWSMQKSKSRNILLLDEPFKELKGEVANHRALNMIKEVSREMGLQIFMISDERISRQETVEATDKLFETSISNRITKIKEQ